MINLGRLKIKNPFILAPIDGYSDYGLRQICYDYGCSYAFTPLIATPGFIRKQESMKKKLDFYDKVGIQFISNNTTELKKAIQIVNNREFYPLLENITSIDLNLGCPSMKMMNVNMGSALLNQPKKIRELFRIMVKHSKLPVSAKIRLAINSKHKKTKPYLRISKIAQEEGLDFITIHGRTSRQQYSGEVDIDSIKEVSEEVSIPLIGNGNIVDEGSAMKMLDFCDAVMIGRQAVKEPFIFKQLNYFNEHHQKRVLDTQKEKMHCIKQYLELAEKHETGFQLLKIHMQSFLKGIPGQKDVINKLTHTKNIDEIKELMKKAA